MGHTLQDVLCVRRALSTRIPYELVDIVLNLAQYWVYASTRRDTLLQVQASNEPLFNAKWIYMLSDPIPPMFDANGHVVPTQIQSVHFSINSCDQGWGGFPEYKNVYRNSYTWFEASIIRSSSSSSSQPLWLFEALHKPVNLYTTSLTPAPSSRCSITELHSPYKNRKKRWLVQMNVQASRHVRRHDIMWYPNSPHELEYDEKTGSGRGFGFVDALRAGDRIALVARALYPGWENNVQSAEIEIAYQI
ncbi:hypothetical protein AGABI2DRAFT_195472 [Agaricus bisporus var. bisporus H97]|uniref:hypothetical protein n=1 Tax=Agaricus bisporus var. bisporus (strain H97 / ATCC MYA-4626 / FGSC 10389) TaxID=936046 RepID=UPI00029F699B|nr:hypothetical protein AGABI2DRAFT_195472 [Agaricus bisporus var. bisporus H97]EKV43301.1 hypothetical protein AGABI2DRAFT_195472 [Agaricus bisporus var. bisporus H97]